MGAHSMAMACVENEGKQTCKCLHAEDKMKNLLCWLRVWVKKNI